MSSPGAMRLLDELGRLGVQLWAESDLLRYRAPRGALTADLLDRLKESKADLLELLRRPAGPPPYPPLPPLVPRPEDRLEPFPLSEIQQAYLLGRTELFELGGVGPTSYLEADWPDLDVPRLEAAWKRIVERHDMLRSIVLSDGNWRILPEVPPFRIGLLDLRGLSPHVVLRELAGVREEMSRHPFQPERWPLFEMLVTRFDGGRARLHVARDLLIGDARSSEVLLEELMLLYPDLDAELPPLTLGIRDYALAVDALRDHEVGRRAQDYWRGRLATLPSAPDLPLAPKPGCHSFVRRHGEIEPDAWTRLAQRAALAGLTPSVLLCAAFAEVLAAWSRGDRFSINILYSRRLPLHPQVNRLVGNFASTVLLEVDGREPTFELRASRLQERLWEDLQHGLVGGVEVLREANRLQGNATRASMPVVFSSLLPLSGAENGSSNGSRVAGRPELVFSSVQTPQVALEVLVTEVAGTVHYTWNSVEEAFPPYFVAAMFEAWRGLIRELGEGEGAWRRDRRHRHEERCFGCGLVPASQLARRRRINATEGPEPDGLLQEPVDRQAALRPDDVAVVAADRRLTYGELSRTADRYAGELLRLGARPGRLVAVMLEKSWEQAVAVLAVLRAGGAYLPIDPGLPQERRWFLLEQGEVEIALTHPGCAGGLGWPKGIKVVSMEDPGTAGAPPAAGRRETAGGAPAVPGRDELAYVLFTSGSTGTPKGVMIEHRGAANTVADVNRRFGISAADRVLALSSLSFDLSVWDLFGVLGAGGRMVMPDPAESRDPAHWHELVVCEGVTVWNSVPALVELYVDHLERHGEPWPSHLRLVMMSGDWIPVGLPGRIRALGVSGAGGAAVEVISLGGATEASIWSIAYPIGEVDPSWKSIPYGRPMTNQTFEVLDERLDPCPDWVPGQLYIGGAGLARGYWKDEARTRASFPVHPRTGQRLYRTGDLGRWLPDGNIEFLGREDLQVKIQGYRVELGEVEAVLARHPGVRDAVVAAVGERQGHKRLVAWYVADSRRTPGTIEATELRAWLEARLPDYMVPHLYVPLEALPLTANGKVDRKALPSPDASRPVRDERFSAPRTPTERTLARLWETVLSVPRVGLHDELFELGGDSMLALRLLAEIEKELGCRLPLAAFFQEATVARLAALVDDDEPKAQAAVTAR
jgi:amino acid adenylation domain-containing protein